MRNPRIRYLKPIWVGRDRYSIASVTADDGRRIRATGHDDDNTVIAALKSIPRGWRYDIKREITREGHTASIPIRRPGK